MALLLQGLLDRRAAAQGYNILIMLMAPRNLARGPRGLVSPLLSISLNVRVLLWKALNRASRYWGHSMRMCFIVRRVSSPQCSQEGGGSFVIMCPWVSLLWPSLRRDRMRSQRLLSQVELGYGDRSSVIWRSLLSVSEVDIQRFNHASLLVLFM